MPVASRFDRALYVGVDIGKVNDPAALSVLLRHRVFTPGPHSTLFGMSGGWSPWRYDVLFLERLKLGTRYPAVIERLRAVCGSLRDRAAELGRLDEVVIDVTGVGRPVFELAEDAQLGCLVTGVNYTGGRAATPAKDGSRILNLPKVDLVAGLVVLFQSGVVRIAEALPDAQLLVNELVNFQETVSSAGRSSFGNDGVNAKNDDLVNCVALAAYRAERRAPKELGVSAGPLL